MKIALRKITEKDIEEYKYWQLPIHQYHNYNGPYFSKSSKEKIEREIKVIFEALQEGNPDPMPKKRIISNENNALLGEVSWYWKSKETNWLEIGIVIFDERNWGKGIGKQDLKLWIEELFNTQKEIVRVGLTTWSGNEGMIHLAEKLKMEKEAVYRKARIVNGNYYDSVSYGLSLIHI